MKDREFSVIEKYFKTIATSSHGVVLGPGDDCAVLAFPDGAEICMSTDTLVEGVHFPVGCAASMVATRAMGANLSDLAAMGASPHSFLMAMTMPAIEETWLSEYSATLAELIGRHQIALTGGNLATGPLSITVTVVGYAPAGQAIMRSGAKIGDQIFVTGTLGDAAAGLELVSNGTIDGYLAGRYAQPTPRLQAGIALRGIASAMIDISDGLVADLGHLATASQAGAVVRANHLRLSKELIASCGREQAERLALTAGDDYELCFTVHPNNIARLNQTMSEIGETCTHIGEIQAGNAVVVQDEGGEEMSIDNPGYKHF